MVEFKGRSITEKEVLGEIADQYRKNDVFRMMLRNAPMTTIAGLGIVIPEGLELEVRGDNPETECLYLVVPEELADNELEKVANSLSNNKTTYAEGTRPGPLVALYGIVP
jgi:hypothetical protein